MIIDLLVMVISVIGIGIAIMGFIVRKRRSLKLTSLIEKGYVALIILFDVVLCVNLYLAFTYIKTILQNMKRLLLIDDEKGKEALEVSMILLSVITCLAIICGTLTCIGCRKSYS